MGEEKAMQKKYGVKVIKDERLVFLRDSEGAIVTSFDLVALKLYTAIRERLDPSLSSYIPMNLTLYEGKTRDLESIAF